MKESVTDLTQGKVLQQLLRFFFPVFAGLLFQQLYNTVDAIIVGRFVSSLALAAVGGSASTITTASIGFFSGLSSGATVIVSQKYGAKDWVALKRSFHTATFIFAFIGIFVSVLGIILAPWGMRATNCPEDILGDAILYLRIYLLGAFPMLVYGVGQGTLQAIGDVKTPLICLILSTVLNIALDLVFVALLRFGVAGVAYASLISMIFCLIFVYQKLSKASNIWHFCLKECVPYRKELLGILKIGLPAGLQRICYSVSNLIIISAVNSFGSQTIAAWTGMMKLDGVTSAISSAFGVTACTFVGQCYGARKMDRLRKGMAACLIMSLSSLIVFSGLFLCFSRFIFSVFLEQDVVALALRLAWYFFPFVTIWGGIELLSNAFRGIGDTLRPMLIILVGTCVVRIIWIKLFVPLHREAVMVALAYGISWSVTLLMLLAYYLVNIKAFRKKTEERER